MECAACANDGFEKEEIKSKTIFIHKFLEFCYFLVFELRNQHDCVEKQEEGIMNGVYIITVDNHVTCGQCANRMLQRILMENQYIFAC